MSRSTNQLRELYVTRRACQAASEGFPWARWAERNCSCGLEGPFSPSGLPSSRNPWRNGLPVVPWRRYGEAGLAHATQSCLGHPPRSGSVMGTGSRVSYAKPGTPNRPPSVTQEAEARRKNESSEKQRFLSATATRRSMGGPPSPRPTAWSYWILSNFRTTV